MTYAANLGRDRIIRMLHELGATDLESAAGRAALQGKIDTVRMLYELAGRPPLEKRRSAVPRTRSASREPRSCSRSARGSSGRRRGRNTMEHLLGTDSRKPAAKHRILEMYVEHGLEPAGHAGDGAPSRADRPARGAPRARPAISSRARSTSRRLSTGARVRARAVHGAGNAGARNDAAPHRRVLRRAGDRGSGCSTVAWIRTRARRSTPTASAGTPRSSRRSCRSTTSGSTTARASRTTRRSRDSCSTAARIRTSGRRSRQRLEEGHGGGPLREYRDVTPLGWGERYDAKIFVSRESLRLIEAHGGRR